MRVYSIAYSAIHGKALLSYFNFILCEIIEKLKFFNNLHNLFKDLYVVYKAHQSFINLHLRLYFYIVIITYVIALFTTALIYTMEFNSLY